MTSRAIRSGPYRIEFDAQRLLGPDGEVHLAPLEWSLLGCLLGAAGATVTKAQVAQQLWPGAAMSEYALSRCVRRLREAIGDDARRPRFVKTVHGVGFRWIADVDDAPTVDTTFVGRVAQLESLDAAALAARAGRCTTAIVEGSLGVGKTRLSERFIERLGDEWQICRGRCAETRSPSEPYGPILDAIESLLRDDPTVLRTLRACAPTWLAQMPWLATSADNDLLTEATQLTSRRRMLHELSHFLDEVSTDRPTLLFIDDLHWADPMTVDALQHLAVAAQTARLMIVVAVRTSDLGSAEQSVALRTIEQDSSGVVVRVPLEPLATDEIRELARRRLTGDAGVASMTEWLLEWTAGNPLFVAAMIDHAVAHPESDDAAETLPTSLNDLIDNVFERLDPLDQDVVETLAVCGTATASVVARALDDDEVAVERRLRSLVTSSSIIDLRDPTDAPMEPTYELAHAAYRQRALERVGPIRVERIHHSVASALATTDDRTVEPGVIADHFVLGGDRPAAVPFWLAAAKVALARIAHDDALRSYELVLDELPHGDAGTRIEIEARLGAALCHLSLRRRFGDRADANIDRLNQLVEPLAAVPDAFNVWRDVLLVNNLAGRTDRVRAMAPPLLAMAEHRDRPHELMDARHSMAEAALHAGDLDEALAEFDRADEIFTELFIADDGSRPGRSRWIRDTGSRIKSGRAGVKLLLGRLDEVRPEAAASHALCHGGASTPLVQIGNATICASVLLLLGDEVGASRFADRALAVADDENEEFLAIARTVRMAIDGGTTAEARRVASTLLERPAIPFPLGPLVFVHARLLPTGEMLEFVDDVIDQCRAVDTHWCDDAFATARRDLAAR